MSEKDFKYPKPRKAGRYEKLVDHLQRKDAWKKRRIESAKARGGKPVPRELVSPLVAQYLVNGGKITMIPARGKAKGW